MSLRPRSCLQNHMIALASDGDTTNMVVMNRLTITDPLWEDIQFLLDQVRAAHPATGTTAEG